MARAGVKGKARGTSKRIDFISNFRRNRISTMAFKHVLSPVR
jgi:hypothetical protein